MLQLQFIAYVPSVHYVPRHPVKLVLIVVLPCHRPERSPQSLQLECSHVQVVCRVSVAVKKRPRRVRVPLGLQEGGDRLAPGLQLLQLEDEAFQSFSAAGCSAR